MLQLTYISTASAGMTAAGVDQILHASRLNNEAAGVTGLLLYDGYRFLQALEGESESVRRVFERVKGDPRHRALVTLSSRETGVRMFGSWAMAAQRVAIASGNTLAELIDALTAGVDDPSVQATFRSFARLRLAA